MRKLVLFTFFTFVLHAQKFDTVDSSLYLYKTIGDCNKESVSVANVANTPLFLHTMAPNTEKTKSKKYSDAISFLQANNAKSSSSKLNVLDQSANIASSKIIANAKEPLLMTKHNNAAAVIVTHTTDGQAVISYFRKGIGFINKKILPLKQSMKAVITARNSDIITISEVAKIAKKFSGSLGGTDILLTRFTSNLKILWQKRVGTSRNDYPKALLEMPNEEIVIGSVSDDANQSSDLTFLKTDAKGNKIWFKTYVWESEQNLNSLALTAQNSILVNATFKNKNNHENIWLFELDNYANVKWQMRYLRDNDEALYDLVSLKNEQYLGVGYSDVNYNKDALIRIFDKNGSISSERKYGGKNSDLFNKISLLDDETIYLSGCSASLGDNRAHSILLKTNPSMQIAKKSSPAFDRKKLLSSLKSKVVKPLEEWRVSLDKNFRFTFEHPRLNFKQGVATLNESQEKVLKKFFLTTLDVLKKKKVASHVKSIRIEGFASSEFNSGSKVTSFLGNAKLSSERALNVLDYILNLDTHQQKWLMQKLSVDGHSFSKRKFKQNIVPKREDFEASRRVEISIEVE